MTETKLEIRIVDFWIDANGIIICKFKEVDPFPTYEDCLELVDSELKLAKRKPYCVLTDFRDVFGTINEESKKLFATHEELIKYKIAEAIVVNTFAIKLMVKSYLLLFKPVTKTKVFSDENEAKTWLVEERAKFGE